MNDDEARPRPGFKPTRWTLVLRARGQSTEARGALADLCAAYYPPVLVFVRACTRDEEAARDLTQDFFAGLLSGNGLDTADPSRGRFRSFLLGAVKHFLADQRDRAIAAKRGGGQSILSLEANFQTHTTAQLQIPDPAGPTPDSVFDREWAQTLVGRAADALAHEFGAEGNLTLFDTIKPWLLGQVDGLSQADAAAALGMTEGAVKVAIHRLRRRFRALVKMEIAQTLPDPGQVQEELRYLVEVLAGAAAP